MHLKMLLLSKGLKLSIPKPVWRVAALYFFAKYTSPMAFWQENKWDKSLLELIVSGRTVVPLPKCESGFEIVAHLVDTQKRSTSQINYICRPHSYCCRCTSIIFRPLALTSILSSTTKRRKTNLRLGVLSERRSLKVLSHGCDYEALRCSIRLPEGVMNLHAEEAK